MTDAHGRCGCCTLVLYFQPQSSRYAAQRLLIVKMRPRTGHVPTRAVRCTRTSSSVDGDTKIAVWAWR
jgi:hypothetical protein